MEHAFSTASAKGSYYRPGHGLVISLTVLGLLVIGEVRSLQISVHGVSIITMISIILAAAAYASLRGMGSVAVSGCIAMAVSLSTVFLAAILEYLAAIHGGNSPLIDAQLIAADRSLHLDPIGFIAFVDRFPFLCFILGLVYWTTPFQQATIAAILIAREDYEGFDAMTITLIGLILIGAAALIITPSIGFLATHAVTFVNTSVDGGRTHLSSILSLRSGAVTDINLDFMPAIITFPSGHAALGVLTTVAALRIPYAFWPVAILNLIMLPGAVVHGGHYFVDLFAGIACALILWPIAGKISSWRPAKREL